MTGCLGISLLLLFPLLFLDSMRVALLALGIPPDWVSGLVFLIVVGSFVNIPVWRRRRDLEVKMPLPWMPGPFHRRLQTVALASHQTVCLNVGGGLVPAALSFYQIWRVASQAVLLLKVALVLSAAIAMAHRFSNRVMQNAGPQDPTIED